MYKKDYMLLAIEEAKKGFSEGEIPVGAVWIDDSEKIIIKNHNRVEQLNDPLAHAEMLVIKEAIKKTENIRLGGTLYLTMVPCLMCSGAILLARIKTLYYGVENYKYGTKADTVELMEKGGHAHKIKVYGGYEEEKIKDMLKKVFNG